MAVVLTIWHGHILSDRFGEALLYLPDGEQPTEALCRSVDRAMRKGGAS